MEIYVLLVACGDGCGGPRRGVISEVCAKQTVVGSDFATIRTHPTYVRSEEVRLVRTCPRGVGEGDTMGIGVRRFRTT